MTTVLYQEWLQDWDKKLRQQKRKIVLLQDNFSGHVVPEGLTNVVVMNFSPNLTSHVQPCDQGIIRAFKAHYRRLFMQRALDRYDEGISPSAIYEINQLEAMRLADLAWDAVKASTMYHCWIKSGILPDSLLNPSAEPSESETNSLDTDPVAAAEKGLVEVLDGLQDRGALQKSNPRGY